MGQNLCSNSMFRLVILGKEWHCASTVVFGGVLYSFMAGFCLVDGFWLVLFVFYFIQDNALSFPNYTGYYRWMWSLYFIWSSSEKFSADISWGFFSIIDSRDPVRSSQWILKPVSIFREIHLDILPHWCRGNQYI